MVGFASLYPPYDYLRLSIAAAIRSIHPPCLLDLLLAELDHGDTGAANLIHLKDCDGIEALSLRWAHSTDRRHDHRAAKP